MAESYGLSDSCLRSTSGTESGEVSPVLVGKDDLDSMRVLGRLDAAGAWEDGNLNQTAATVSEAALIPQARSIARRTARWCR